MNTVIIYTYLHILSVFKKQHLPKGYLYKSMTL